MGDLGGPGDDDPEASVLIDPNISIIEGGPIDIEDSPEHRQARASTDLFRGEEDVEYGVAAVNAEKWIIDRNPTDKTSVWIGAITLSDQCLAEGHWAPIDPQLDPLIIEPMLPTPEKFANEGEWGKDRFVYNTAALGAQQIDQKILGRIGPSGIHPAISA